jgi:hypothetical protein
MSAGKVISANAQYSNLTCGFIMRSEVDPGSKFLKIAAFVNNDGYTEGEKIIYGNTEVRHVEISEHHKAKIPFISEVRRPQSDEEWNEEVEKSVAALVLQDHATKKTIDQVLSWKKNKKTAPHMMI